MTCDLRRLPGVGPGQVARPELDGVAQVDGPLAREVHHEGAVGDGGRRLAGVAQQRDLDPGGGLDLSRAHAGQPPGPLPVTCTQHDRRLRTCSFVPLTPTLR